MRIKPEDAARRDKAIVTAWEKGGKTYRDIAAEVGCSPAVVSRAIRAVAGPQRAPGAGRPKTPLLNVVIGLCEAAIEIAGDFEGLPPEFTGPASRLRDRKSWKEQLRKLTTPPPPTLPEQLEIDVVAILEQQVVQLKAVIDGAEEPAAARHDRETLLRCVEKLERFRPAPERSGKREVDVADLDGWLASARGKLEQAAAALKADVRDKLEQCRQDGLMTPEAREVCRRLGHLPKESDDGR